MNLRCLHVNQLGVNLDANQPCDPQRVDNAALSHSKECPPPRDSRNSQAANDRIPTVNRHSVNGSTPGNYWRKSPLVTHRTTDAQATQRSVVHLQRHADRWIDCQHVDLERVLSVPFTWHRVRSSIFVGRTVGRCRSVDSRPGGAVCSTGRIGRGSGPRPCSTFPKQTRFGMRSDPSSSSRSDQNVDARSLRCQGSVNSSFRPRLRCVDITAAMSGCCPCTCTNPPFVPRRLCATTRGERTWQW